MKTTTPQFQTILLGVEGRMSQRIFDDESGLFTSQSFVSAPRSISGYGTGARLTVEIRFDDHCGNGHQSFSITGNVRVPGDSDSVAGGSIHDEIADRFPEFEPLIKWHNCSTDGPMHYIGNTCYHAGDRDHNGLLKDEKRQIINGRTGTPAWELVAIVDGQETPLYKLEKNIDAQTAPTAPVLRYVPWCTIGEGKKRDLEAARHCAVWPDATDEQLMLPRPELENLLEQRLPALLADFRTAMDSCGFEWEHAPHALPRPA